MTSQQPEYFNWLSEPDGRGTFSIIFACVSTLFFCSSKILKPNILPLGWRGYAIHCVQIVAGMFVPEIVFLMALGQFFDAKGVRDTVNAIAEEFVEAKTGESVEEVKTEPQPKAAFWQLLFQKEKSRFIHMDLPGCHNFERWTLAHGFYAIMGGFEIDASKSGAERPERLRLRPHVLIDMAVDGRFKELNIAADELEDKSNFDSLGTTVAFIQALWLCAQSIARVHEGLAITLLEVSTVAHVVMSTFTFVVWLQKPQSITRGHIIMNQVTLPELETMARYERIRKRHDTTLSDTLQRKEHYFISNHLKMTESTARHRERFLRSSAMRQALAESSFLKESPETLWMFHINQSRELRDTWFNKDLYYWSTAAFWGVVTLFGAVHVAASRAHFPTSVEGTLWLISSIIVTSAALLYGIGALVVFRYGTQHWKDLIPSPNGPPVRFSHMLGSLAIGCHIYLFVESWISLRSLPESASETVDWLKGFPHIS